MERVTVDRLALAAAVLAPPAVALALLPARDHIAHTNVALILVVVVVAVAVTGRRVAAALAAVSAAFWFDYFFTVPYFSPRIANGEDVLTAGLLLVVGLAVGQLSSWALRQRDEARRGREDIGRIHYAAELAAQGESVDHLILAVSLELRDLLFLRDCQFSAGVVDEHLPTLDHDARVRWGDLGWGTATLGLPSKGLTLAAHGQGRVVGTFTLTPTPGMVVSEDRLLVAVALADQVGAALAGYQTA
jgi:K+-sensing histidine kinase KdpD